MAQLLARLASNREILTWSSQRVSYTFGLVILKTFEMIHVITTCNCTFLAGAKQFRDCATNFSTRTCFRPVREIESIQYFPTFAVLRLSSWSEVIIVWIYFLTKTSTPNIDFYICDFTLINRRSIIWGPPYWTQ